jgi:hypothetical protein
MDISALILQNLFLNQSKLKAKVLDVQNNKVLVNIGNKEFTLASKHLILKKGQEIYINKNGEIEQPKAKSTQGSISPSIDKPTITTKAWHGLNPKTPQAIKQQVQSLQWHLSKGLPLSPAILAKLDTLPKQIQQEFSALYFEKKEDFRPLSILEQPLLKNLNPKENLLQLSNHFQESPKLYTKEILSTITQVLKTELTNPSLKNLKPLIPNAFDAMPSSSTSVLQMASQTQIGDKSSDLQNFDLSSKNVATPTLYQKTLTTASTGGINETKPSMPEGMPSKLPDFKTLQVDEKFQHIKQTWPFPIRDLEKAVFQTNHIPSPAIKNEYMQLKNQLGLVTPELFTQWLKIKAVMPKLEATEATLSLLLFENTKAEPSLNAFLENVKRLEQPVINLLQLDASLPQLENKIYTPMELSEITPEKSPLKQILQLNNWDQNLQDSTQILYWSHNQELNQANVQFEDHRKESNPKDTDTKIKIHTRTVKLGEIAIEAKIDKKENIDLTILLKEPLVKKPFYEYKESLKKDLMPFILKNLAVFSHKAQVQNQTINTKGLDIQA